MAGPFGPDIGSIRGASRTKVRLPGSSETYIDLPVGENPWAFVDRLWDFTDTKPYYDVYVPIYANATTVAANAIPIGNTEFARALVEIPRAGRLISAQLVAEDALAANDTNYVTFAITNKLASGSGTVAMLAATDANTTKATGGVAISAVIGRSLTVHGTAANLIVVAGDIVEVRATSAGTLANAVYVPVVRLRFATIPADFTARTARTAGVPLVGPVDGTANGEVIATLSATSEAQTAGFDWGDQVQIPANKGWIFEALVRVNTTGITTAQSVLVGMGSAYNATWNSIVSNAWFLLDASMALKVETDDGTTDSDDQSTGQTLVADTYYLLRIDASNRHSVQFWVNNKKVKTLSAAAWAVTDLMQPVVYVRKASGTTTPSVSVDFIRLRTRRF